MKHTRHTPDPEFVWLTPTQAAAELGVHRATIHRLIAAGELKAVPRVRLNGVAGRRNAVPLSSVREYQRRCLQASTEGTNHVGTDTEERRTSAAAGSSNR